MTTYTLKAKDVTPQSIRALHQHITGRGPEELREFLTWISEGLRYGHDLTLTVGKPEPDSGQPWCNHDPAALTDVNVLRCECGATIDPDSGDVIGEGETGPDAVALGLTEPPYDPIAQQIGSEAQIRDWHASEDHKDCHPRQHDPRI